MNKNSIQALTLTRSERFSVRLDRKQGGWSRCKEDSEKRGNSQCRLRNVRLDSVEISSRLALWEGRSALSIYHGAHSEEKSRKMALLQQHHGLAGDVAVVAGVRA